MKRFAALLLALGFAMGSVVLGAQQQPAEPEDTNGDDDEQAMVRFVHAAPNADIDHVLLTSHREGAGGIAVDGFDDVGYADMSDYVAVPAGSYDVTVVLEAVEDADLARVVPTETLDASAGGFYTVTLLGLVVPQDLRDGAEQQDEAAQDTAQQEDAAEQETETQETETPQDAETAEEDVEQADVADPTDDAFMAWLQGLFATDADRSELDLRLMVLDDEAMQAVGDEEMRVRVVHAAPGTEPVSLAVHRANGEQQQENDQEANEEEANDETAEGEGQTAENDVEILHTVSYGEASDYVDLESGDTLEIRTEDGEAVILDLSGQGLETGMLHTVFVTGTPVAVVPVESLVASTQPREEDDDEATDDAAAEVDGDEAAAEGNGEAAAADTAEAEAADAEADDATAPDAAAAQDETAENGDYAMVRFVHAAPNAEIEQVLLTQDAEDTTGLAIEGFAGIEYGDMSDYVAVAAGSYEAMVVLDAETEAAMNGNDEADGEGNDDAAAEDAQADVARVVPGETLDVSAGGYYTITLLGLAVPERVDEQTDADAATDDAFIAWLEGLFADEAHEQGEFALRLMVLDDEATTTLDEDEARVRIVHAAPGTEPVALAIARANGEDEFEIAQTVGYGEASGYVSIESDATLEIRTEDGEAVILELADQDFEAGSLHTVFVTGTPVEEMPIEAMVSSVTPEDAEQDDGEGAGLTPGATFAGLQAWHAQAAH